MTEVTLADTELAPQEPVEPTRYFIDTHWYESRGRSFRAMAQGRFCAACLAKVGTAVEDRVPVVEKKSSKVVFQTKEVAYGDQPMVVIRGCCSKQRNYITPDTPLIEAVFRVFLATGNQPATVERVREQLGDWVSPRDRPHNYSEELITILLKHDRGYGMHEFAIVE